MIHHHQIINARKDFSRANKPASGEKKRKKIPAFPSKCSEQQRTQQTNEPLPISFRSDASNLHIFLSYCGRDFLLMHRRQFPWSQTELERKYVHWIDRVPAGNNDSYFESPILTLIVGDRYQNLSLIRFTQCPSIDGLVQEQDFSSLISDHQCWPRRHKLSSPEPQHQPFS